jgi:two-component system sensor histidine kinase YesM
VQTRGSGARIGCADRMRGSAAEATCGGLRALRVYAAGRGNGGEAINWVIGKIWDGGARLVQRFQNISFRNKLLAYNILVAMIPFSIFAAVGASYFVRQASTSEMKHTVQMVGQVENSIDVYIGTIEKLANITCLDLLDSGFFEMRAQERQNGNGEIARLVKMLQNIAASHQEIAGILIATDDDQYVSTGMSRISRDSFADEEWYRTAVREPDSIVLVSSATGRNIITNKDYSVDDVFSLCKALTDQSGRIRGVVLFDVRHDIIRDSISSITIGEKGFIFVTDSQNNVVYTPTNDVVYRVRPQWLTGPGVSINAVVGSEKYQIHFEQSDYTGWKIVGVFSVDEVMGSVNSVIVILAVSIGFSLALVLLASLMLSSSVTVPLLKLKQLMRQAESGSLSARYESDATDEIGELGHTFNHMLDQIEDLIQRVYIEQQSKRNAELKILQEQIKPHFLYNTLDTISWMARDHEASDIVRLVDALTSMFRIGLSHGKDFISVREEFTHVSNYLYIQKIRYKDKLSYTVDVADGLHDYQVPKLILQPLVENAIYHGIKQKRGGGTIKLAAGSEGDMLLFSIHDDGTGIPKLKLAELNGQLGDPAGADEKGSFGLFYVQKRIRLCYGAGYGVTLESKEGFGTVVSIALPAKLI